MNINKPTMSEDSARFWNALVAAITALSLIVGGLYTLKQYFDAREKDTRTFYFQVKVAQVEAQKQYYVKVLDFCSEATAATATIATSTDERKKLQAAQDFWRFYYGPLVIVENAEVGNAMSNFGNCVKAHCWTGHPRDQSPLLSLSLNVAHACADEVMRGLALVDPPTGLKVEAN